MQRIFSKSSSGIQAMTGDQNPHVLRFSTANSFCSLSLIPRLHEFQQLHIEIMIQLTPSSELVDFKQSNIDLAIRMGRGRSSNLIEKKSLMTI